MKKHTGKWYGVMLHHTAGSTSEKIEQIRKAHINNNHWGDIGYHYVIEVDPDNRSSKIVKGRSLSFQGAHAGVDKYNNGYVGVCVPGNYDKNKMPDWLYNQLLGHICHIMKKPEINAYGFLGHKEVKATACPGRYINLDKMRYDLSVKLKKSVRAIKL